jgi:putative phage-type endonuclease
MTAEKPNSRTERTAMKTEQLVAGTPEWMAHRARHFNASDAPAMLGCSPHMTRSALLRKLHTGIGEEHDAATEARFAAGHRFEALARPLAEKIIGDDLAPVVGTMGELSASFDGLTLMGDTAFEHKTLNEELRGCMGSDCIGRDLPDHYRVQMEQQLLVSGAERVLFMASNWDGESLVEERHCWYEPDAKLRAEIVNGWKQFAADLAAYKPEASAEPAPSGRAPETLPALRIEVTGMVTASNLDAFKDQALAVFKGINRTLTTDAEFADAEKTVKWCGEVEDRLKAAKQHALSQTESIDNLFRAIDEIGAEARLVRLELEKLVKARKEAIRGEIVAGGVAALRAHTDALTARIGKPYLPVIPADFGGKIKGLKTVASIRDAVDGELARAKIHASSEADKIEANLKYLREHAKDYTFLFADTGAIVLKQPDDLQALVTARIADHKAAEAKREAARQAAEAAKPAPTPAPAAIAAPAPVSQAPNVVPMGTRSPAAPVAQQPAGDEWQSAETLPKEPTQWIAVQEVVLYRWAPYKPTSAEARRGVKGRWQRHNGYGFENSEPPHGMWRIGEMESAAA